MTLLKTGKYACTKHPKQAVTMFIGFKMAWCGDCGRPLQFIRNLTRKESADAGK